MTMRPIPLTFALLAITLVVTAGYGQTNPKYPPARRGADVDVLHGERIPDPYRWLEDLNSPETRSWVRAQDDLTRKHSGGDAYQRFRRRIARLGSVRRFTVPLRRGDRWFFFETDANGSSGRRILVKDGAASPRSVLSNDSDSIARTLSPTSDGHRLAYAESLDGSRWLRIRIVDPETGALAPDQLVNVHTSMAMVAWEADGSAFYYVRSDAAPGDRATAKVSGARVMRHVMGTPQAQDVTVMGPGEPSRLYAPVATEDGSHLIVTTSIGAGDQRVYARNLRAAASAFVELFPGRPGQYSLLGKTGGDFWFLTTAAAPRSRVIRVPVDRASAAVTVIPEPPANETIVYVNFVAEKLIVMSTRDAAPVVRIHSTTGGMERTVDLPALTTVWGASGGGQGFVGRVGDREAYYAVTGVGDPGSIYRLDPRTGATELFMRPEYDFTPPDFVGRQVFYRGRDGTRIPMFIAHHKRVEPQAGNPLIMYGYGAFRFSAYPWFQPHILAWMESGGLYAIPGIRGGGEYGEAWHEAGLRDRKQTTVDDYLSAAEWLVQNNYTTRSRLVANGGSISGFIAAAAIIQRPELFAAAIIDIPALDLLRYDRFTGAAAWIPELGSTASPVEFRALRRLSPLHNLEPGTCYPPMLVLAGERDEVAVPSHAYKFIAAVQHTQTCASPAYLQVAWGAAHTFGTSSATSSENWARQLAFVSGIVGLDPGGGSR